MYCSCREGRSLQDGRRISFPLAFKSVYMFPLNHRYCFGWIRQNSGVRYVNRTYSVKIAWLKFGLNSIFLFTIDKELLMLSYG